MLWTRGPGGEKRLFRGNTVGRDVRRESLLRCQSLKMVWDGAWHGPRLEDPKYEECNNAHRTTGDPTRKHGLGKPSCHNFYLLKEAKSLMSNENTCPAKESGDLMLANDHPAKYEPERSCTPGFGQLIVPPLDWH